MSTTPTFPSTLTLRDVVYLSAVVDLASASAPVKWLDEAGDLVYGTARCIGDERGCFLRADEDIRGAFLRITTRSGFDLYMPVMHAMRLVSRGEMAKDRD